MPSSVADEEDMTERCCPMALQYLEDECRASGGTKKIELCSTACIADGRLHPGRKVG